jgi:hypothetical protein
MSEGTICNASTEPDEARSSSSTACRFEPSCGASREDLPPNVLRRLQRVQNVAANVGRQEKDVGSGDGDRNGRWGKNVSVVTMHPDCKLCWRCVLLRSCTVHIVNDRLYVNFTHM